LVGAETSMYFPPPGTRSVYNASEMSLAQPRVHESCTGGRNSGIESCRSMGRTRLSRFSSNVPNGWGETIGTKKLLGWLLTFVDFRNRHITYGFPSGVGSLLTSLVRLRCLDWRKKRGGVSVCIRALGTASAAHSLHFQK